MTANRVVITPPGNGEWSLVRIVNTQMNLAAGQSFTQSIYVKATDASQIGKKVCLYSYNTTTTTYGIISQTTLTGDWQKVSVTQAFVSASTQQEFSIGKARAAAPGQNGTIGITDVETATDFLVWGAQLELGQTVSRYQIVNTSTDYDTTGFPMYLSCDGVDDGMATASIDFSSTDKITKWAGIRKLSDAAQGVLVELSANASSNAGSFNVSAPSTAAANYSIRSGGTTSQTNTVTPYKTPISNVITGVLDIGNDILTARVNGVEIATVTSDQGTGNYGNYPLYLFSRGGTTLPFKGNFYGLVIRGTQSTPKQISQVEKYLALKTGVSL